MANIKNIIYKAAKKIASTKDLDINAEELASLALYKVMNMPYFEEANDFLTLHYNVFEELSIGNLSLNNLKGYTNGNIESFVVIMDKKDHVNSKIDEGNQILKKKDLVILETFMNVVNNSRTLQEIVNKVILIEKEDPLFLNKAMTLTKTSSYNGNKLIRAINQLTPYQAEGKAQEYLLENQSKVQHYRNTKFSNDLKEIVFDSYSLKKIADKPMDKILEDIEDQDVKTLTGIVDFKKENLSTFPKLYPNEYENSLYKIFKENQNQEVRCSLAFDLYHLKESVHELNKNVKKLFKNKSAEEKVAQYDEHLQPILQLIAKSYPQIMKTVDETPYEIKTFIFNSEDEKETFIAKEAPLEIYQDEWMSMDYTTIRGNSFYKQFYREQSGIYIAANNGLEDIIGSQGYLRSEICTGGHRIEMDNVRINRVYESGRDVSLEIKQNVIEAYVKMAIEKNVPFVYDIIERGHKNESKFNRDMHTAIENLKEKYSNVMFINDGMNYERIDRLKTDIQCDLLAEMASNKVPYDKMLLVDKKLQEFFKTSEFETAANLDYFDRKQDTTIEKAKKIALNELTKNKIKVSP